MSEEGKAAVIHPTGTGKSFIGFKLADDHPASRVCWLSPSEYIVKTQLENLNASESTAPNNIAFYTYAKLLYMEDADFTEIEPDFVVLDEFHRCGAAEWGKGVEKLLAMYPSIPVLGLSATNIRYLDNRRDMADELFDGHIASEMTLGEAIVRNILLPPTYVISLYSYQRDLDKYAHRAKHAKNKAVRDAAEEILGALRRALEHAEGLDEVFHKHMTDKHGKYIVFCANAEHMDEMIARVPEWFSRIDAQPHVYRIYTDAPETNKAFTRFKSDASAHLKLLFCIDMLNEGVHVEDISGVILFRPTVSPIIYKQQIGRALCANKKKQPIIFDVVNNFDNLYSIGAIEQEMRDAIINYQSSGENKKIITEKFRIVDEVRDCRELFEALNDTLTASWDIMYAHATEYYKANGSLDVPRRYKTPDGYSLGSWLNTQRRVRAGSIFGNLTPERICKLDEIGMIWHSRADTTWEKGYAEVCRYFEENGHINVPALHVTTNGFPLGTWLSRMRALRKGTMVGNLTQERIELLDALKMIWDVSSDIWEQNYKGAEEYFNAHGNLEIPCRYINQSGLAVGAWLHRMRGIRAGKVAGTPLTENQINRLDAIGMRWTPKHDGQWEKGFAEARRHFETHGDINALAQTYKTPSGYPLGKWLERHRMALAGKSNAKVTPERKKRLDSLGMVWQKEDPWEERFALAQSFFEANKHLNIPQDYVVNGAWLGKWLYEQRRIVRGEIPGMLTDDQKKRLDSIGMDWRTPAERAWEEKYAQVKSFFEEHGHLNIPPSYTASDGSKLRAWLSRQRALTKENKLTQKQICLLAEIGFEAKKEDIWAQYTEALRQYVRMNGDGFVPKNYVSENGLKLGCWLSNQRAKYNGTAKYGTLSSEQVEQLESLGISLNGIDSWAESFAKAKAYYDTHGTLVLPNPCMTEDGYDLGYWIYCQRKSYRESRLTDDQISQLNSIGMDWLNAGERKWNAYFEAAKLYWLENCHLRVPATYRTPDGIGLGRWLAKQKKDRASGKLSKEQIADLSSIGMEWNEQTDIPFFAHDAWRGNGLHTGSL